MIRILLVDDHPVLRHGLRALLETQADFEVVAEAGSRTEATDRLARHPVDVALVDLELGPDQPNGIEVTRALRAAANSDADAVQVIVFTAFDSDADVVRAAEAGAASYLVKDSRPEEVFRAIRAAATRNTARAGNITELLGRRAQHPDEALTARELEVLALAATGLSNRELAGRLTLSEATVKTHLHHAFTKLGADSRQAAIAAAIKRGLIRL